jgi:hypothetical protein
MTGADGAKINYNALEFKDRPAQTDEERKLIEDIAAWLDAGSGDLVASALRSSIPGSNLVELPLGEDHGAIKEAFIEANPKRLEGAAPAGLSALPAGAGTPGAKPEATEPPAPKKAAAKKELTEEQKAALQAAGLDF